MVMVIPPEVGAWSGTTRSTTGASYEKRVFSGLASTFAPTVF
jgi:hypothetical protein